MLVRISRRTSPVVTRTALVRGRLFLARSLASNSKTTETVKETATTIDNATSGVLKDDVEPPKSKPRGRFFRRFLLWTVIFSGVGYGGSVYYSLHDDSYRDFFTDNFPFAEEAVAYFEERAYSKSLPWESQRGKLSQAKESAEGMLDKASSKTKAVMDNAKHKVEDSAKMVMETLGHHGAQPPKDDNSHQSKEQSNEDSSNIVVDAVETASNVVLEGVTEGNNATENAVDKAKAKAKELTQSAREKARKEQRMGLQNGEEVKDKLSGITSTVSNDDSSQQVKPSVTLVDFQSVDQEAPSETNIPKEASSEPRTILPFIDTERDIEDPALVNIAKTVNHLVELLNEVNAPASAHAVVEDAKKELNALYERMDKIRKESEEEFEKMLAEREEQFQKTMAARDADIRETYAEQEERWMSQLDLEREKLSDEYRIKLDEEMAKAAEQMQLKLKEELVDQGIEMQRRWIREIKLRVEEERSGRLGRLDQLSKGLKNLARITVDNSESLEASVRAHALRSAIVALKATVDSPIQTPFSTQLQAVKNVAGDDELVSIAMSTIQKDLAEKGVVSFADLVHRFENVREQVRKVALVPDKETGRAGVVAHLFSIMLSTIMFQKHGLVPGDDVESVLARSEHFLSENDLDSAVRELNQLRGWPRKLAKDWIKDARARLEVKQAIDAIETKATLDALSSVA